MKHCAAAALQALLRHQDVRSCRSAGLEDIQNEVELEMKVCLGLLCHRPACMTLLCVWHQHCICPWSCTEQHGRYLSSAAQQHCCLLHPAGWLQHQQCARNDAAPI